MQKLSPKYLDDFTRDNVTWQCVESIKAKKLFSEKDWGKIFPDLSSFNDVDVFLSKGYGQCMVAYNHTVKTNFAFIFLYCEDEHRKIISFHGGGLLKNNSMQHYVALVALIDELFASGYKIRTSCLIENVVAFRFLHSVGFMKYRSTLYYSYMWLPYKRFIETPIYKKINQ